MSCALPAAWRYGEAALYNRSLGLVLQAGTVGKWPVVESDVKAKLENQSMGNHRKFPILTHTNLTIKYE